MQINNVNAGWIYILTNSRYKELIKIGKTTRTVEERAKELSKATGVPEPFKILYKRFFEDCHQAEKDIHIYFDDERVKDADREFFSVETFIAIQILDRFYYEEKFKSYDTLVDNLNKVIEGQAVKIDNLKEIIYDITKQLQTKSIAIKKFEKLQTLKIKMDEIAKKLKMMYET